MADKSGTALAEREADIEESTAIEPSTNGNGHAPAKRKMPDHVETFTLKGDYEGWTFTANNEFTFREMDMLFSSAFAAQQSVLSRLVRSWDFVDRDGEPIPFNEDGWKSLSLGLLDAMRVAILGSRVNLPNG